MEFESSSTSTIIHHLRPNGADFCSYTHTQHLERKIGQKVIKYAWKDSSSTNNKRPLGAFFQLLWVRITTYSLHEERLVWTTPTILPTIPVLCLKLKRWFKVFDREKKSGRSIEPAIGLVWYMLPVHWLSTCAHHQLPSAAAAAVEGGRRKSALLLSCNYQVTVSKDHLCVCVCVD